MNKKQRTIYALKAELLGSNRGSLVWSNNLAEQLVNLLNWIMALPEKERIIKGETDNLWILWLSDVKREGDNIYGTFSATSNGLHTTLLDSETLEKADNPKGLNQNEIKNTVFSIRVRDGLFLLAHYTGNVAIASRIRYYLDFFAKRYVELGKKVLSFQGVIFYNIVSKKFLDGLNKFDRLNQLSITIDTTVAYGNNDGIAAINNETVKFGTKKIVLTLSGQRYKGLTIGSIKEWVKGILGEKAIVQAVLKGHPLPGESKELRLRGLEEKFVDSYETDIEGEVITALLYDKMRELNEHHKRVRFVE